MHKHIIIVRPLEKYLLSAQGKYLRIGSELAEPIRWPRMLWKLLVLYSSSPYRRMASHELFGIECICTSLRTRDTYVLIWFSTFYFLMI